MEDVKFTIIDSGSGKKYIQCVAAHENDLGIVSTKRGFIEMSNQAKAVALLEKLKDGSVEVRFGRPNRDGLCAMSVAVAGEETEEEADEPTTLVTAK